jgi:DNA-binding CsgD family transcriptional regulator
MTLRPRRPAAPPAPPMVGADSVAGSTARRDLVARFAQEHALSPREMEVVDLAARGLATKEIACRLGCSEPTVAAYWARIYKKLNCRSHGEVIARLLDVALRDA